MSVRLPSKAGSSPSSLTLKGRIQSQFVALGTDIDNTSADPAPTQHFFLRRVYLGVTAKLADDFTANLTYDFAGSTFDEAFIRWSGNEWLTTDVGLRKAPMGLEEWGTSSGKLKAIERSPVTRYMVESNNGRRLGAASYRQGVFVGHDAKEGFTYNVAITNPEREESSAAAAATGNNTNNGLAYYANIGYGGKIGKSKNTYKVGASYGVLPDQGGSVTGAGTASNVGKGFGLDVYSVYGTLDVGKFALAAEYWGAQVENGAVAANTDASPSGFYIQPSYKFTDKLEGVVRYSCLDTDGRGVALSDGVRSAPSAASATPNQFTMNKMSEWYIGGNWYFKGDDVKLQVGYIMAESSGLVASSANSTLSKATATGIRAQMQIQF